MRGIRAATSPKLTQGTSRKLSRSALPHLGRVGACCGPFSESFREAPQLVAFGGSSPFLSRGCLNIMPSTPSFSSWVKVFARISATWSSRSQAYLSLGHHLNEVATRLAIAASDQRRASGRALTFRDRVLSGLARKMHGPLRALVDDGRARRIEAMHHLKTMAEAFIYFHVVIKDDTARTAELVLAEATLHQKVLYLRANPAAAGDIQEWEELRDLFRGDGKLDAEVGNLAKAHSVELGTWYSQSTGSPASRHT